MTTILIIAGIGLIGFLAWKGFVNFKKKKRERKPDLTISIPIKHIFNDIEWKLIDLINNHRSSKGLLKLYLDETISTVCQEHSLNMAKKGKPDHLNAILRTNKLRKEIGIKETSEVVAYGQGTAAGILKMWLKSPTHKKAIEGQWTKFGLSIEKSILRRNYTTCIFTK